MDKAVCGAMDSWCDVTAFLQENVSRNELSVSIRQPFQEIGGDPAPGKPKKLVIDYQFRGVAYRLSLEEEFPVAFTIELPPDDPVLRGNSPLPAVGVVAPGAGPRRLPPITGIPENVTNPTPSAWSTWSVSMSFIACLLSLLSVAGAAVALAQVRRIKKQLKTN